MRSSAGADQLGGAEPVAVLHRHEGGAAPESRRAGARRPGSAGRRSGPAPLRATGSRRPAKSWRFEGGGDGVAPGRKRPARSRTPSRWQITAMGSGKASASMRSNPAAASAEAKEPAGDLADRRLQAGYRLRGDATADEDRPLPAVRRYPPASPGPQRARGLDDGGSRGGGAHPADRRFSSSLVHQRGYRPPAYPAGDPRAELPAAGLLTMDPPDHTRIRRLVSGASPRRRSPAWSRGSARSPAGSSPLPTPRQASTSSTRWPSRCPSR